jgi:hypothetical protein
MVKCLRLVLAAALTLSLVAGVIAQERETTTDQQKWWTRIADYLATAAEAVVVAVLIPLRT